VFPYVKACTIHSLHSPAPPTGRATHKSQCSVIQRLEMTTTEAAVPEDCDQPCDLAAFQTSSWYSKFQSVCFPTRIVPLPRSAVEYLQADGISAQDLPSAVTVSQLPRMPATCVLKVFYARLGVCMPLPVLMHGVSASEVDLLS
jgi:D123